MLSMNDLTMNSLKSEPLNFQPKGNIKKYLSYREAWSRIKQAQEQGFYLEAVTLVESILSDRLTSYLMSAGTPDTIEKLTKHQSLNTLITWWRKSTDSKIDQVCIQLQTDVDKWRTSRNQIVHGMVKSYPGKEIEDIESFLEAARQAAQEGERLARAVSSWCSKAKKKDQKSLG